MKLTQHKKGSKSVKHFSGKINHKEITIDSSIPVINIWTDGSVQRNGFGGPGTWAFVIESKGEIIYEESGYSDSTTNNRMEISAVLNALGYVSEEIHDLQVIIHTDSSYVYNSCTSWIYGWQKRGYKKGLEDIPNADLWRLMYPGIEHCKNVQFKWCKGHSTNEFNNRADELCTETYQTKADAGWKPYQPIDAATGTRVEDRWIPYNQLSDSQKENAAYLIQKIDEKSANANTQIEDKGKSQYQQIDEEVDSWYKEPVQEESSPNTGPSVVYAGPGITTSSPTSIVEQLIEANQKLNKELVQVEQLLQRLLDCWHSDDGSPGPIMADIEIYFKSKGLI